MCDRVDYKEPEKNNIYKKCSKCSAPIDIEEDTYSMDMDRNYFCSECNKKMPCGSCK